MEKYCTWPCYSEVTKVVLFNYFPPSDQLFWGKSQYLNTIENMYLPALLKHKSIPQSALN